MINYLIKKKIESDAIVLEQKKRCFLNFDSVRRILIFFDQKDWDSIVPIIDDMKQCGKSLILWTIGNKKKNLPEDVTVINSRKDISWMRTLKPKLISTFEKLEYDTLLDLSLSNNLFLLALKVKNTSRFSIGFKRSNYRLYDFTLLKKEDENLFTAYLQAKIYLINNA